MAKLAISGGAVASALEVFGARGYPRVIFSGTFDIQRVLAAREMGL